METVTSAVKNALSAHDFGWLSPKVETHTHLDGTLDPEYLFELARKRLAAGSLPETDVTMTDGSKSTLKDAVASCGTDLQKFIDLASRKHAKTLPEFLQAFGVFVPIISGDMEALEEFSYRFVKTQGEQKVLFTEVRYNPHLFCNQEGKTLAQLVEAADEAIVVITKGIRRAEAEFPGIRCNQILCGLNFKPEWMPSVVDLAIKHMDKEHTGEPRSCVVGVDIAAGEGHFLDPAVLKENSQQLMRAKKAGLGTTIHAGEEHRAENVVLACEVLGATRIGHGYAICGGEADAPGILYGDIVREAYYEVCPSSSAGTGNFPSLDWPRHPAIKMLAAGLKVTLNSDDASVTGSCIAAEHVLALEKMLIPTSTMESMTHWQIDSLFRISAAEKTTLHLQVADFFAKNNVERD